jgi:hypothetical protein
MDELLLNEHLGQAAANGKIERVCQRRSFLAVWLGAIASFSQRKACESESKLGNFVQAIEIFFLEREHRLWIGVMMYDWSQVIHLVDDLDANVNSAEESGQTPLLRASGIRLSSLLTI